MRSIWSDQVPHLTEKLPWLKQLIMWKICTKAKEVLSSPGGGHSGGAFVEGKSQRERERERE